MKKGTTILLIALLIAGCWLASCSNTGQPSRNLQFEEITLSKSEHLFADDVKSIEKIEKSLTEQLRSTLGIGAKVHLVNPKSITRSEGKAVRIIDKRKI